MLRYRARSDKWAITRAHCFACWQRRRFGYRRIYILLKREGWCVNVKRVYRLYRHAWSMDFVHGGVADGRRIRCLNVVDDCTKESIVIEVDTSISGERVARVLDRIAELRPLPRMIRVDHGPEFTSLALDKWAHARGVKLAFIQPGKPTQNAYIESFNGHYCTV